MTRALLTIAASLGMSRMACAQNVQQVVAQGEKIFNQSCATGYCHGQKGAAGGAPRLAARDFDQAYINNTVTRGVAGTAMPGFASALERSDLVAVVAYVATLNGIANPNVTVRGAAAAPATEERELSKEAAQGRVLFYDAVRGFGRCSTCHEVRGMGIPVASPIAKVPGNVQALRGLATPQVRMVTLDGEAMPALVVSAGKQRTVFYDLTSVPPVQRTADSAAVTIAEGSAWRHGSVLGSYNDGELGAVLAYLRAVVNP